MADSDDKFRALMRQVRDGSQEAAWELVHEYGDSIRRAVRRALHIKLRPKFDSLDFVQIVWKSFFRVRDNLDRFDSPHDLAAFLVGVARNKVRMESRRLACDRNDVGREEVDDGDHAAEMENLYDPRPQPVDVAIAREQWDRLLEGQPAECRQIIQMRLQGHTYEAIGGLLRIDKGEVYRILQKLLRKVPV